VNAPIRYRFADFLVSPRRRALFRNGREVALIPRYFDLLLLLLERRHEAVHRNDIFALVWSDVVVSDGALSQAVRTIRRVLDDDSREPRFVRTIARHGYRFVYPDVVEERDEGALPCEIHASDETFAARAAISSSEETDPAPSRRRVMEGQPDGAEGDAFGPLLDRLTATSARKEARETQREAAERLHVLGTAEALERLARRGSHPRARAWLRETRWDVPGAGAVPLVGTPDGLASSAALARLRLERAWRDVSIRWLSASAGGAGAGLIAGALGGLGLWAMPAAEAPPTAAAVLAFLGAMAGAIGAAGVGAGLAAAEALARSGRFAALVIGGGLGGLIVGAGAMTLLRWTLEGLFGVSLPATCGAFQGLVLGGAAGLGYGWATRDLPGGGMAAPHGRGRLRIAVTAGLACALATWPLGVGGCPLVGGLVNAVAKASEGSRIALAPLGHLLGEPEFGPIAGGLIGMWEGAFFGAGLALGLTRRPAPPREPELEA
jgi:DNA-binding winged helix-turn-helix (wHTH) protein